MGGGGVDWQDVGCVTVAACDLFGTPPSLVEHFPIESFPSCLLDDSTQSKINNTLSKRVGRLVASDVFSLSLWCATCAIHGPIGQV